VTFESKKINFKSSEVYKCSRC